LFQIWLFFGLDIVHRSYLAYKCVRLLDDTMAAFCSVCGIKMMRRVVLLQHYYFVTKAFAHFVQMANYSINSRALKQLIFLITSVCKKN